MTNTTVNYYENRFGLLDQSNSIIMRYHLIYNTNY